MQSNGSYCKTKTERQILYSVGSMWNETAPCRRDANWQNIQKGIKLHCNRFIVECELFLRNKVIFNAPYNQTAIVWMGAVTNTDIHWLGIRYAKRTLNYIHLASCDIVASNGIIIRHKCCGNSINYHLRWLWLIRGLVRRTWSSKYVIRQSTDSDIWF